MATPETQSQQAQKQSNDRNIRAAAQRIVDELTKMLGNCDFFTTNLTVTVQGGIVRTAKVSSEECINFHAQK